MQPRTNARGYENIYDNDHMGEILWVTDSVINLTFGLTG